MKMFEAVSSGHPNDAGYAMMAEMMLAAIRDTNYRLPSASCGRMSIVPAL